MWYFLTTTGFCPVTKQNSEKSFWFWKILLYFFEQLLSNQKAKLVFFCWSAFCFSFLSTLNCVLQAADARLQEHLRKVTNMMCFFFSNNYISVLFYFFCLFSRSKIFRVKEEQKKKKRKYFREFFILIKTQVWLWWRKKSL